LSVIFSGATDLHTGMEVTCVVIFTFHFHVHSQFPPIKSCHMDCFCCIDINIELWTIYILDGKCCYGFLLLLLGRLLTITV